MPRRLCRKGDWRGEEKGEGRGRVRRRVLSEVLGEREEVLGVLPLTPKTLKNLRKCAPHLDRKHTETQGLRMVTFQSPLLLKKNNSICFLFFFFSSFSFMFCFFPTNVHVFVSFCFPISPPPPWFPIPFCFSDTVGCLPPLRAPKN